MRHKMLRCSKSELERKNSLTLCMQTRKFLACKQALRMGYSEVCFRNKSRNNPYGEPACRRGSFSHSGSGGRTESFLSGSASQQCSFLLTLLFLVLPFPCQIYTALLYSLIYTAYILLLLLRFWSFNLFSAKRCLANFRLMHQRTLCGWNFSI